MSLQHDLLASVGEFVGTTMFLCEYKAALHSSLSTLIANPHQSAVLAFGGAKTALYTRSEGQMIGSPAVLDNEVSVNTVYLQSL
jgi:hypothetical protein